MEYIPHTEGQIRQMLEYLDLSEISDLFSHIPAEARIKGLDLPPGIGEAELSREAESLSESCRIRNRFIGAGRYRHIIPSIVDSITSRPEFYTAYTPYQSEASQGMLEALYEFQSMMCELTGMQASNAGMYDGATALAEACLMAVRKTGRKKIVLPDSIHPHAIEALKTYGRSCGFRLKVVESKGVNSFEILEKAVDGETAALAIQNPDFLGRICMRDYGSLARENGCMLVSFVLEAVSLGILKPLKDADIVCGDAQSLGNSMNYGGPSVGFLCTREEYVRQMPGRIVGETTDKNGGRGYVLTFQTREQHIRRERATSNICTAESLNALAVSVYLASMGPAGLRKAATQSHKAASYLKGRLLELDGSEPAGQALFFNEFIINRKKSSGGLDISTYFPGLEDARLYCATEADTKKEIDEFIELEAAL